MKATGSPSIGRFQRRPSLGTSIARAMISMSPDVTFDRLSEISTSLSIKLCESLESTFSGTSCFSPSTALSHITGSSSTLHSMTDRTTTSNSPEYQPTQFHLLEIPNELNIVFNRLDAWQEPHSEQHIIETSRSTNIIPTEQHLFPLNNNTGTSSFMKYIQENTNLGMKWDRLLAPIKEPFTRHMHEQQHIQLALSLFKLILRFVNTSEHDTKRDRALGDYIVQMGLMNEILRDEILIQIINQIWNNIDLIKLNKAWLLMFNCIGCFPPSSKLYKHLFNFVSEENPSNNELSKRKLLAAGSADAPRTYPPTQLEWSANKRSIPMALQAEFFDNFEILGEVESWMTGEQYAYELVSSRGILKDNSFGWTVSLEDNDIEIELMGHDYLLDLISELEIPPCSPVCKSFFLIHDGRDHSSKSQRRRNHRTTVRSKEWFLKIDNRRSSRLSKNGRRVSSSNCSSPYKYPKHFSSDDQQQIEKKYIKHHSPVYHDVTSKKSNSSLSLSSESLYEHQPFPPPPSSATKDLLKLDATSAYSITDGQQEEILIQKNDINIPFHQDAPALPPLLSSSRSSREKLKIEEDIKSIEKRVQVNNQSSINKINLKSIPLSTNERRESIRKTNTFTSSSHSMIDAGCGGHLLSKIPALRCFRPTRQHHTQKSRKTSPLPPPPLVVSDYSGADNPTSFYGEFSVCSDGPANLNQYEKIGSSIHNATKLNGHNDDYRLSSVYSDGDIIGDVPADLTEYEIEDAQIKRNSPTKDISKPGTKFIKNKLVRPKSGYPQAKKPGNSIFDSESIATITDLPLPCHKSDVEAFLDDLFDRALDPKNLAKKKNQTKILSTFDQRRLQMISNSHVDPSVRRRGLSNLLHKNHLQKKSSIRSINGNDKNGKKIKIKNEKKDTSERKKPTKTKKKRNQQLNTNNNNNNATMIDHSLSSFTSENRFILPQIGYSSRTETDDTSEYTKYIRRPKHRVFYRQPNGFRNQRFDRIRQFSTVDSNEQNYIDNKHSHFVNHCYPQPDKKNIKLIPINPTVCFATTTSTSTITKSNQSTTSSSNSNGPVFVPVINISGKKYLPVYLKQSADLNNPIDQINQSDQMPYHSETYISQVITSNQVNSSKKPPTIIEETEVEIQSNPTPISVTKPNICVERLSMSQLDSKSSRNNQTQKQSISKENSTIYNNRSPVKVSSHIFTRRSPESQKNLRAKTVRIGKIRWPPPLNPEESDNANQQRRMLVQRRIQEEIHGGKTIQNETHLKSIINISNTHTSICQNVHHIKQLTVEQKFSNDRRSSQSDERILSTSTNDQQKKISTTNTSTDRISQFSDNGGGGGGGCGDDDVSTNEIVTRNQSSKSDFHQTLTPMIGKENFELRKKLFENPDDSSFADVVPSGNEVPNTTSKSSSRQSHSYLTYHNIVWKLKIRKEVFSPIETFDQPLLIDLLYLQIVHDTFSTICIRISEAERTNMKTFLTSHGVGVIGDINLINKLSIKKSIIEQARQWATYFCRFYPVSIPKYHSGEVQMLGISHLGIRLIKRSRTKTNNDTLQVLETFPFDIIQQISPIRNGSTIDLRLTKKRITIHSHRIQKITQLIDKFLKEFRIDKSKNSHTSNYKSSHEILSPNLLSNTSDLLKSSSQGSLMSCSQTFSELIPSTSFDNHTPKPTQNDIVIPNTSALPGGYSIMEFALQNFQVPSRKQSKKSWKTSEWTWQDYTELIKWSKSPIQSALLRHISNDTTRTARQSFLAIMRFMGDQTMSRGQSDIDCLFYLLKSMHKHRTIIDEIICQIIKQLTDNKSTKHDSVSHGWKLLAIILNYFIPSENLRPYFVKYLNDNINQNERLVRLCLNHYEQTLKYGGRKNTPNKAEIDLFTVNDRITGKRQLFLLPGGFPLALMATPSMIIDDCLNLLCQQLNISNSLEHDEYSIFIISASENSSRLLNPNEYLFDILSECVRSNMDDYHLIIKRMLWFTIPMIFNDNNKSEIFVDFMYHQLVPELLEGTMIIIKNNHMPDELMQQISLMAALQFRASNKIGLPSMREVKHLLPSTVLKVKNIRPQVWTTTVHEKLDSSVESMTAIEAKLNFLNVMQTWPLFGTTFFTAQSVDDPTIRSPCLIGIFKNGILFLDIDTRETFFTIPYNDVVSIRRHQNSIDIKHGSLSQPHLLQCQVDRAQDLVALAGRYLSFIGRSLTSALERKCDSQQFHRPSTSTYNDPISTIL